MYSSVLSRLYRSFYMASNTKLVRFKKDGLTRAGVYLAEKNKIVDFNAVCCGSSQANIESLLENWEQNRDIIAKACESESNWIDYSDVEILYPLESSNRIIGLGANYPASDGTKGTPFYFEKSKVSVTSHNTAITIPRNSQMTDYEGELVVIVGKGGKYIKKEEAMRHVGGYTICNDLTEKGFIKDTNKQIMFGKSIESYLPVGPCVLVANPEIDPTKFTISTFVNGEKRQNGKVSELIISIPEIVEQISKYFHLYPGDMILTGTPDGSGSSFNPPTFIKGGDKVEITIPEIGTLSNIFKEEEL